MEEYSALELKATCPVWSLETLAYYLKGYPKFDLWTDHSPLAQTMKKEIRTLTPQITTSVSLFSEDVNQISDLLSRAPVGGPEAIEGALK